MSEREREEPVTGLEQALRALTPAPVHIDRDLVMFRAGQQAAAPAARRWRAACICFALATAGIGGAWWWQPPPAPEVRFVEVPVKVVVPLPGADGKHTPVPAPKPADATPVTPKPIEPMPMLVHHRLQNDVLRHGLDVIPLLPAETNVPSHAPNDAQLRELYQGMPRWRFSFSGVQ